MKLGFIGLGKMGTRMARKLLVEGQNVVAWNRSPSPAQALEAETHNSEFITHNSRAGRLEIAETIEELVSKLQSPRIIWLMLPAGEATDSVLKEVSEFVKDGDIVIDGGNSHFADTDKRSKELSAKGIGFLGIGVSGGVIAAKEGYPLMVGGDKSAYSHVAPLLDALARPGGGHVYFGAGGAGHYVKMVHNAIEYGYMQAIGEGFGVLEKATYDFDLEQVAKIYQKGTLISGFMMDRAVDALQKDPKLENIEGVIGRVSAETAWTIDEAKKHQVPIEITEKSLAFRTQSETDEKIQKSLAARLVSALRHEFGGHAVKKKS